MPLVRIDIPAGTDAKRRKAISDTVHDAMVATLNVPKADRFQVITEHAGDTLVIDPNYLDIARSRDALLIQVTLNEGRSVDMKKAFYKAVADGLHVAGMRREDITINLIEVKKENWSFGNGIAQYA
jgi:4-oxalocrotonate tautomerase